MAGATVSFELPDAPAAEAAVLREGGAVAWSRPVEIPTYEPAEPDPHPMYFDRRVYQGSSGRVYPLPFTDRIATQATPRTWEAVHLENRWLRVMVLPELGGRIHVGHDRAAGYDFLYRNTVIKPALVGLAGPWISGGIEFNWPQHHRPATFLPVDWRIEHSADGSVTVWCSDHDPFTRMRGTHGIRLRPDRATIEVVVRLHNRTSLPQTFLWWANAAVRVHDDYQSFFPTDVHWVADHARRAITAFPIADRPYYGVDYPSRDERDLSWWRTIPVPTSYMVTGTQDDFFGGYDHRAQAGFVHVADRTIAPGKKQWSWGDSAFGRAWYDLLTDDDGPYIELMSGVFTDNQPDFSWLAPGETREFSQHWYPIQRIGVVHQANEDAAVHLGADRLGIAVTRELPNGRVRLRSGSTTVLEHAGALVPGDPFVATFQAQADPTGLLLEVFDGPALVLAWRPRPEVVGPEPEVATSPGAPASIASADELYLAGLHLAQYRHPTRSPEPYWLEALRRDPGDARCNLAMAVRRLESYEWAEAERYARAALARLTARNANPRDGEAGYVHGLALARLGRTDEALDAFAKAAWSRAWRSPAAIERARLLASLGRPSEALASALRADSDDPRAAVLVAELGGTVQPTDEPLDLVLRTIDRAPSRDPRSVVDAALELAAAGGTDAALRLLELAAAAPRMGGAQVAPIAHYHRARILDRAGRPAEAASARDAARSESLTRCFPWGGDDHDALIAALDADPGDVRARHLLALLLAGAGRTAEALEHWNRALADGLDDPVAWRTSAVLLVNLGGDQAEVVERYERALRLAPDDARLWFESDVLRARMGESPDRRLTRLLPHRVVLDARDDAMTALANLLTATGRADEALELLRSRRFAPWEGGEGRVIAAWDAACLAVAAASDPETALAVLDAALDPPRSLGEARHPFDDAAAILDARDAVLRALGRDPEPRPSSPAALGLPESDPFFATSDPDLLLVAPPGASGYAPHPA